MRPSVSTVTRLSGSGRSSVVSQKSTAWREIHSNARSGASAVKIGFSARYMPGSVFPIIWMLPARYDRDLLLQRHRLFLNCSAAAERGQHRAAEYYEAARLGVCNLAESGDPSSFRNGSKPAHAHRDARRWERRPRLAV